MAEGLLWLITYSLLARNPYDGKYVNIAGACETFTLAEGSVAVDSIRSMLRSCLSSPFPMRTVTVRGLKTPTRRSFLGHAPPPPLSSFLGQLVLITTALLYLYKRFDSACICRQRRTNPVTNHFDNIWQQDTCLLAITPLPLTICTPKHGFAKSLPG